ncbi:hypothetical protein FNF31_01236 [Cafeteria roenbergensis]|uniref:Carboxylesterase type B domain-containing protein n=1 Tax=Cafeteria roenbergensis TaxID=33653 RepID=A0A5A8DSU3_CAFRO|nr:hypothetical protein FNF31_01236 [Cafeteria roenbergensis]KAA0169473.1 hypothetical protein FNF28_02085 [Cafeteria roenbergensis]
MLGLVSVLLLAASAAGGPLLKLDCGRAEGVLNASTGVAAFKGIPYAMPPLGDLRFAKTVSLREGGGCWAPSVWNASKFGDDCMQSGQFNQGGAEDCLFINTWIPSWGSQEGGAGRPVMVYSYGGDLTDGRSSSYDMAWLAERTGHVIVSMNYRVNLFGFLALRELSAEAPSGASGNFGFWDQLEALRWVQTNAAALGADRSRVTFFGQSSGGTSVFALLAAPLARGTFSRAISLSGSANLTMGLREAESQNVPIAKALGCDAQPHGPRSTPAGVVACLRNLSALDVQAAVPASWNTVKALWSLPPPEAAKDARGMAYQGIAIVDGELVTAPLRDALRQGTNPMPFIVSSLAEEADAQPGMVVSGMDAAAFEALTDASLDAWGAGTGAEVRRAYGYDDGKATGAPAQLVYDSIMTDYGQTCASVSVVADASRGFAKAAAEAGDPAPAVYQMYVSARPTHPVWGFDATYQPRYAFHSLDILAGLGHWDLWSAGRGKPAYQPEHRDTLLRDAIAEVFGNFTRDGALSSSEGWQVAGAGCPGGLASPSCYTAVNVTDGGVAVPTRQLREDICTLWSSLGFDERFWWSN